MKERVLITGASGFVGYHLILEALKNDMEVYAAIRKSSNISHLKGLAIQFTYPDFDDINALKIELNEKKYHYIIHAAGLTRARSAEEYDQINAGYTHNLALAAVESELPPKKFVLISSLAAGGPLNSLNGIITDNTPPAPVTAYGRSKLLAEQKLAAFFSLNYVILRPTGVYGPRDRDIFIFFKQIAMGFEPYIGKAPQKFSFIYAADLAQAAIKALNARKQRCTYNLSDGNFYNRYQLADNIKDTLKIKTIKIHLPVNFVKIIATVAQKYGSLKNKAAVLNVEKLNELTAINWFCDIQPAITDLGFEPKFDLRAGVDASVKWYKENKWL